jgi:2-hydroxyacyl-CoA lyase 1
MLAVSGPGLVHALAGLANAQANCWPLVLVAGSCARADAGRGAFQELDQLAAAAPFVKLAVRANAPADVPAAVLAAYEAAAAGRPGAAYVDIPSDVLMEEISSEEAEAALAALPVGGPPRPRPAAPAADVAAAAALLCAAARPLAVVGKGAAYARAEAPLRALVAATGLPFLATSMGRGVVPDEDARCANAARSAALAGADVALVFGGRLNWQLHFGDAPKWAPGVKFILVDPEPSPADAARAAVVLRGDAGAVAEQLLAALAGAGAGLDAAAVGAWAAALAARAAASRAKLAAAAAAAGPLPPGAPLDYAAALRVIRAALDGLDPPPAVVAEGANTMDQARLLLGPARAPRCRLDAGTWGTMGVGPGYAMAAAAADPGRRVVALEGDSAFGFSAMEVETMCRYRLPITVLVFNNGGIYGGDRRPAALRAAAAAGLAWAGAPADPPPTAFVPGARYELLAEAFGGAGAAAATEGELADALAAALVHDGPTVINIAIDPAAGVESASVHAFNFFKDASAEAA